MRRFIFVSTPCVLFVLSIGLSGQTLKHRPEKSETPAPAQSKPSEQAVLFTTRSITTGMLQATAAQGSLHVTT